ncbi:ImmA/IrrE family metallo-endopeptidase [Sporosarcina luteola]|uniref:ImmA/IrrE family metallo-endopeptidase n=1 Tax=Sporosarcina luteola TaxID=582850 RepID=UPI00204004D9|nr:ImmA/IrrE family metallo-endopeptidase [Sporosarcina luteola]MCM3638242.1 ImmA/IrrE family metallo-endopeptidase [Sporosarcina luteola]
MDQIREFVTNFRNVFPQFTIDQVLSDLEQSVEDFGVKVFYSDMSNFPNPSDISGFSRVNEKGVPEIVVNGDQPVARRRFTIAHELGHIVLHWRWLNKPNQKLDKPYAEILFRKNNYEDSETLKEQQANEFSAELLAPLKLVKKEIGSSTNFTQYEMLFLQRKIAKKFQISNEFAGFQIKKALRGL